MKESWPPAIVSEDTATSDSAPDHPFSGNDRDSDDENSQECEEQDGVVNNEGPRDEERGLKCTNSRFGRQLGWIGDDKGNRLEDRSARHHNRCSARRAVPVTSILLELAST